VLAIQAVNGPLVPGASAHALGATLAALTLGPARAILGAFRGALDPGPALRRRRRDRAGHQRADHRRLAGAGSAGIQRLFAELPRGLELSALAGTLTGNLAAATVLSLALVDGAAAPLALTAGWLLGVHARGLDRRRADGARRQAPRRALAGPDRAQPARGPGPPALIVLRPSRWFVVLMLLPFASQAPDALQVVLSQLPGRAVSPAARILLLVGLTTAVATLPAPSPRHSSAALRSACSSCCA
jgi:hypothetical protein